MLEPIFVDFESGLDGHVYLLAARIDEMTHQYVCSPELGPIGTQHGLKYLAPEMACREVLSLSARTGRPIACYSSHDANLLRTFVPERPCEYLDVRKLAKIWIRRRHLDSYKNDPAYNRGIRVRGRAIDRWKYISIASWAGIAPPSGYASGKTLSRLRAVVSGLRRTNGSYAGLTPVQKRKWGFVVRHNQFDVEGLQLLFRRIQSELQDRDLRRMLKASHRVEPMQEAA